jgi:hypothetical protein
MTEEKAAEELTYKIEQYVKAMIAANKSDRIENAVDVQNAWSDLFATIRDTLYWTRHA